MHATRLYTATGMALLAVLPFAAQEPAGTDMDARIRQEAASSQIMRTLHHLTDLYGPRLTGSPDHEAAARWAVDQMTNWGLTDGHLEPWDFGREGWSNEHLSLHVTRPYTDALVVEALAWTPGTRGRITVPAFHLVVPSGSHPEGAPGSLAAASGGRGPGRSNPTREQLTAYLESIQPQVAGAAVLVGRPATVPVSLEPVSRRLTDDQARCRFDPEMAGAPGCGPAPGTFRAPAGGSIAPAPVTPLPPDNRLTTAEVGQQIDTFLLENKAALRINDAGRPHGQITAFSSRGYDTSRAVPTVVMRNEDYGRIARTLAGGTPVVIQAEIVNRTHPEGRTSYNAVAEIAGSDRKDEVVMLGGHLDSWHAATGATDNAIGCAVMMEAARILKAIGVQPRRTIRVALWSGEEQGLLGSRAYVRQHFGSAENPTPEFAKLSAYLNMDNGTGRARGALVFGPPEAGAVVREALAPVRALGVAGASVTASRSAGGTDSTSFNNAGLPGINFVQDPIEYASHTHHTNLDTYERVIEEDAKASAITVATLLYNLAMRDEMLPRFSAADLPAPSPSRER